MKRSTTTQYFKWLINSKKERAKFEGWLSDNGIDVFYGKGLSHNEVIKFRIHGSEGILWVTGYSNDLFIKTMKRFKGEK